MKVNESVRASGLKEQRKPDTSSAVSHGRAVKISTKVTDYGRATDRKTNPPPSPTSIACLAGLTFSKKNTI